jgi:bZIP transcription factor
MRTLRLSKHRHRPVEHGIPKRVCVIIVCIALLLMLLEARNLLLRTFFVQINADHILSYFLGAGDGGGHLNHLASSSASSTNFETTMNVATSTERGNFASTTTSAEKQQQHHQLEEASWLMPPPQTPAVQFYPHSSTANNNKRGGDHHQHHHHHKSHHQPSLLSATDYPLAGSTSQSSSSSSLSSMAATLVSGVISPWMLPPVQHHQAAHQQQQQVHQQGHQQQQQQQQQRSNNNNNISSSSFFGFGGHNNYAVNPNAESPISPAQMFGSALENLFLPQSEQHLPFAVCEPPPAPPQRSSSNTLHFTTTNTATNNHHGNNNSHNNTANSNSINNCNMGPPEPRTSVALAVSAAAASSTTSNNNNNSNINWPQPILPYSNLYLHPHLLNTVASLSRPTVPESEEKRAIRLERNRMSARRSRRKKKERLETLGAQVNDLHIVLEDERRRQIDCMVPAFELLTVEMTAESMISVIEKTELNNFLHRAILDFQYTQLKTLTMAPYQRFLMWLLLQDPTYFRAKEAQNKKFFKISSKQIGEQLTVQTSPIHDAQTAWPLFCFELKFSVDQEERFVAAITTNHDISNTNHQDNNTNHKKAVQIQMAVDTADRLCQAIGSLSHLVAKRQRQTVLTFAQRQILRRLAQDQLQKQRSAAAAAASLLSSSSSSSLSSSAHGPASAPTQPAMDLSDICRSLESVLHISSVVFVENKVNLSNNNSNNMHT